MSRWANINEDGLYLVVGHLLDVDVDAPADGDWIVATLSLWSGTWPDAVQPTNRTGTETPFGAVVTALWPLVVDDRVEFEWSSNRDLTAVLSVALLAPSPPLGSG